MLITTKLTSDKARCRKLTGTWDLSTSKRKQIRIMEKNILESHMKND